MPDCLTPPNSMLRGGETEGPSPKSTAQDVSERGTDPGPFRVPECVNRALKLMCVVHCISSFVTNDWAAGQFLPAAAAIV